MGNWFSKKRGAPTNKAKASGAKASGTKTSGFTIDQIHESSGVTTSVNNPMQKNNHSSRKRSQSVVLGDNHSSRKSDVFGTNPMRGMLGGSRVKKAARKSHRKLGYKSRRLRRR